MEECRAGASGCAHQCSSNSAACWLRARWLCSYPPYPPYPDSRACAPLGSWRERGLGRHRALALMLPERVALPTRAPDRSERRARRGQGAGEGSRVQASRHSRGNAHPECLCPSAARLPGLNTTWPPFVGPGFRFDMSDGSRPGQQPLSDVMLARVLLEKQVAAKLLAEIKSDVSIDKVRPTMCTAPPGSRAAPSRTAGALLAVAAVARSLTDPVACPAAEPLRLMRRDQGLLCRRVVRLPDRAARLVPSRASQAAADRRSTTADSLRALAEAEPDSRFCSVFESLADALGEVERTRRSVLVRRQADDVRASAFARAALSLCRLPRAPSVDAPPCSAIASRRR